MTIEAEFALRMATDATLMAILTGEVWTPSGYILSPAIVVGHAAGFEGITRETAAAAFDATTKYLKPCSMVKQADKVPTGDVEDYNDLSTSMRQRIEVWLYQDAPGYDKIDLAIARIYTLFQGHQLTGTFDIRLANVIDRQRDAGSLNGASLARLDWQVDSIYQGV